MRVSGFLKVYPPFQGHVRVVVEASAQGIQYEHRGTFAFSVAPDYPVVEQQYDFEDVEYDAVDHVMSSASFQEFVERVGEL